MLSTTTPIERTLKPHEVVLSPTIQNAVGIHAWSKFAGEAALGETVADLLAQVKEVQAQCRATLSALAEIKNPRPVSFVGQANISNGPTASQ